MAEEKYKIDIEETDDEIDLEEDPVEFWIKKQRELITSMVDYNLSTLVELINIQAIDLSPEYQRRFRWDETKQSRLIESFLMNVPVPPVFLNEDEYGKYSVIDGKQRLNALSEFFRGKLVLKNLKVFSDINGKTYYDLPIELQIVLKTRPTLRAIIILRQSDQDIKFVVFQRLNTGGATLNPQEIRNSTYPGPFNNLLLELSVNRRFHYLLGIKNKEQSKIYKEMRDVEFVLRYFTFRDSWEGFSGAMRRGMDEYMVRNEKMSSQSIEATRIDFLRTIDVVDACFGEYAFRRWIPEKGLWRKQVLASLYDAEMFACRGLDLKKVHSKQNKIIDHLKELFLDDEFKKSIDAATNAPGYFRTRILKVKDLLSQAIGE